MVKVKSMSEAEARQEFGRVRPAARLLDQGGRETLDPTPMAPPIGYNKQPTMVDHIRNLVRSERLAEEVRRAGFETAEEADDFEVGDDFDPTSPYEHNFDPPVAALDPSPEPPPQAPGAQGGGAGGGSPPDAPPRAPSRS